MSKAFTKEDDGSGEIRLPDLPQRPHPNYVTPAGLASLKERLCSRKTELTQLRAKGDGFDNKHPIASAERDIRFLQGRIDQAILINPLDQPPNVVGFGAEIEVTDQDNACHTYRIVGEDEADPKQGMIAPYSPLAVALIGSKVGDSVEWRKPAGSVELTIKVIRFS